MWWIVETTAVASLLALVAAVAGRWTRLGPATRHAFWLVVLIKLMMPPLLQWPREVRLAAPLLGEPTRKTAAIESAEVFEIARHDQPDAVSQIPHFTPLGPSFAELGESVTERALVDSEIG